jgi:hypothetical protein
MLHLPALRCGPAHAWSPCAVPEQCLLLSLQPGSMPLSLPPLQGSGSRRERSVGVLMSLQASWPVSSMTVFALTCACCA